MIRQLSATSASFPVACTCLLYNSTRIEPLLKSSLEQRVTMLILIKEETKNSKALAYKQRAVTSTDVKEGVTVINLIKENLFAPSPKQVLVSNYR